MENYKTFIKRKSLQFEGDCLVSMKDIGRKGSHLFLREAWTFMPQSNFNEKVFILERLRKVQHSGRLSHRKGSKKGHIEYRIGYFVIGKNGNKKGKWTWGQYCPLIPKKDFNKLIRKALAEGTIDSWR